MKRPLLTLTTLAAAFALTGCAFVPKHFEGITTGEVPGFSVQERTTGDALTLAEGAGTEDSRLWFARWDDPNVAVVARAALENNSDVSLALASLRSAKASLESSTSALFPTAGLGFDASQRRARHATTDSYGADASASWSFSFGGKNLAERRSSVASARAAAMTLEDVRAAAAGQAVSAYVQMALAQAKLDCAKLSAKDLEQTLAVVERQYVLGLVSKETLDGANSQMQTAKASVFSAEQALTESQSALMVLTHLSLAEIRAMKPTAIPQPREGLAVRISAETLNARADVQAARLDVVSAMENVSAAQAAYLPSLKLSGSYGTQAASIGALGASGSSLGVLAAALALPVLNWGSIHAETERQEAALEKAKAQYVAALFKALKETENALEAVRTGSLAKDSAAKALGSAQSARSIAKAKYEQGLEDYPAMLEADRTLISAREKLASARAQFALAHIDLYDALGGTWSIETGESK